MQLGIPDVRISAVFLALSKLLWFYLIHVCYGNMKALPLRHQQAQNTAVSLFEL
jgi:hypothetical protein